ncbi:GIY-YIG nuclease family protein [Halobacillus salinarum]|uniref:GIY-YIG nuclease family protein n=1 Tax=Halobacillus salinarum TaxID=2932257 RepID=A0ABY4ELE7_9BACI|nr:GIY-YIG nuclease family protein [Halobacillus salinarum]UOQ44688.1 GIY-YIG nuclease family protein [Halobacillus salinarum]
MGVSYYVYILRCKDNTLYTGYTNDLPARLKKHSEGNGAKYTKGRGPFILEYCQSYETKREAMQEEYRLKRWNKGKKETWIVQEKGGCADDFAKELQQ